MFIELLIDKDKQTINFFNPINNLSKVSGFYSGKFFGLKSAWEKK
jgi:hypothetical protein